MHKTAKDGLFTITLTDEEWFALSVGFEKLIRMAKYHEDQSSTSKMIDLAAGGIHQGDILTGINDWCDKDKAVEHDRSIYDHEQDT